MEDNEPKEKKSVEEDEDDFLKCVRNAMGIKQKPTIPNFPINKKIQKKFLKDKPFPSIKKNIIGKIDSISSEEDQKEITKKIAYPSGIIKTITRNGKNEITNEEIDYSKIKEKYINNIKNNTDKELKKIIENAFLLFNRRQIIRNIVKNPLSTKSLEEKILLWKYYIKNLTKEEKALLIRKLLYYIGKFSELVYDEFLKIKEITNAYIILILKGKLNKKERKTKSSAYLEANNFYMMNSLLGYDEDGNPIKEEKSKFRDEACAMMLLHSVLNIKEELNGTGFGYIFLKELNEIFQMYTNSSIIFESIFYESYDIFEKEDFILFEKFETHRILWNFFVDYFIDDPFVIKFLIQLKYIFAIYKQDEVVKYMHDLVLVRWNIYETLDKAKEKLKKIIGPEEIFDEKEKVEKMENIDDVMKYIEGDGDEKPKKKKKKKKKNQNKINMLDDLLKKNEDDKDNNIIDDIDDIDDINDGLSIISEADSVLDSFKNDIIAETEYNTGNKIVPTLSSGFLNKFQK